MANQDSLQILAAKIELLDELIAGWERPCLKACVVFSQLLTPPFPTTSDALLIGMKPVHEFSNRISRDWLPTLGHWLQMDSLIQTSLNSKSYRLCECPSLIESDLKEIVELLGEPWGETLHEAFLVFVFAEGTCRMHMLTGAPARGAEGETLEQVNRVRILGGGVSQAMENLVATLLEPASVLRSKLANRLTGGTRGEFLPAQDDRPRLKVSLKKLIAELDGVCMALNREEAVMLKALLDEHPKPVTWSEIIERDPDLLEGSRPKRVIGKLKQKWPTLAALIRPQPGKGLYLALDK